MIERSRQALPAPTGDDWDGAAVAQTKLTPRTQRARGETFDAAQARKQLQRLDFQLAELDHALVVHHALVVLVAQAVL